MTCRAEAEFPPIDWGGDLTLSYRVTGDDEGNESDLWGTTLNLRALSYIYRPWVAKWFADLGVTRTEASTFQGDSGNQFLTGRGALQLFPQSRFPGELFFEVADSRITANEDVLELGDYRVQRYGYNQSYRSEGGNTWLYGSYEGTEETRFATDEQIDTQQFRLDGTYEQGNHLFDGNVLAQQTTRDPQSVDNGFYVANIRHGYRPGSDFNMDTTASVAYNEAEAPQRSASDASVNLSNRVDWRVNERFRLTSDANLFHRETDLGLGEDTTQQFADLRIFGDYDITSDLAVRGALEGRINRATEDRYLYGQSLALFYSPQPILFEPFSYYYDVSTVVRNRTDDETGSNQNYGFDGSHGLNYTKLLGDSGWALALDANQDARYEDDTFEGQLTTLTNRASATATQASPAGTLMAQLRLFDFRSWGRQENDLQSVDLLLTASRQINRYETVLATLSGSVGRSGTGSSTSEFSVASATAEYFNQRFFGVPNLNFESELRADYNANRVEVEPDPDFGVVASSNTETDRYQVSWRNEVDYAIGLLSVRLTTDLVHSDAGERWSVFVSATRSF